MKKLWKILGIAAFWVFWPVWYVNLRSGGTRARVLVVYENKVLLVRTWVGPGKYELPGGGKHKNETLRQAAVRELREEVGFAVDQSQLRDLFDSDYSQHGLHMKYACFIVKLTNEPVIKTRWPEIAGYQWVSPSDIDPNTVSRNVIAAIKAYEVTPSTHINP